MTDFDAVLERLVTDPSFAAALAADRTTALAGYELDPQELALLSAQLGGDPGAESMVEVRESKASMFGLLAPLVGATGFGEAAARSGFGEAAARSGFGAAEGQAGFGPAEGQGGFGAAVQTGLSGVAQAGFGSAGGTPVTEGTGGIGASIENMSAPADAGFGAAPGSPDGGGDGSLIGGELAGLIGRDMAGFGDGSPPPPAETDMPVGPQPTDYDTRVDVNGDGRWDQHLYRERSDGGIDIVADMDRDGRADFIGHDYDRDGLVDAADYDKNRDGTFETHMFDDDRDGWMDRTITSPEG